MSYLRFCRAILSRDSDARQTNMASSDSDDAASKSRDKIARQNRRYDMALTDALEKDDFGMFEAMGPQVKGAIFV